MVTSLHGRIGHACRDAAQVKLHRLSNCHEIYRNILNINQTKIWIITQSITYAIQLCSFYDSLIWISGNIMWLWDMRCDTFGWCRSTCCDDIWYIILIYWCYIVYTQHTMYLYPYIVENHSILLWRNIQFSAILHLNNWNQHIALCKQSCFNVVGPRSGQRLTSI